MVLDESQRYQCGMALCVCMFGERKMQKYRCIYVPSMLLVFICRFPKRDLKAVTSQ